MVDSQAGRGMNTSLGAYLTMAWTFGLMSLLAIGGANSVIPEMHRLAVDVHHWMNDAQFADMFGIAQLSPGPNVLIVTLIGYHVAGIGGAVGLKILLRNLEVAAQGATSPPRFLIIHWPVGTVRYRYLPVGSGTNFTFSPICAPM